MALLQREAAAHVPAAPRTFYGLWAVGPRPGPGTSTTGAVAAQQAERQGTAACCLQPHPHRPVAALGDVLIHALRCLPFRESLVMVECAVGRGDMTLDFFRRRLPGKRNGRAREVLSWVDRGAESLLETLARTYFRQAGIRVETQVHIEGVGHVDLLLEGC